MGSYKKSLAKEIRNTLLFKVEGMGLESKKLKKHISKVSEELAGKVAKLAKRQVKEEAKAAKAAEKKAKKEKLKEKNQEEQSVASVGLGGFQEVQSSVIEEIEEAAEISDEQPATTSMPVPQDAPQKPWVEDRPDNEGATLVAGEQNEE